MLVLCVCVNRLCMVDFMLCVVVVVVCEWVCEGWMCDVGDVGIK